MDELNSFIPNRDPRTFCPLASYLPSPPASVAEKYIAALTAPGDLVIDPFACTPTIARIAQKMGRRVIAFESHPLWSWLARSVATLSSAEEINAALAHLGDTLKDDTPLRAHIVQLYATRCAACGHATVADYFVHARDAGPIRRHYACVNCGAVRDDSATEEDLLRHKSFAPRGMHYHLAFERVVPEENLHADRIRRMLDLYTPRNLYALVTLTTKIDALFRDEPEREILLLFMLHLLDRGTNFYPNASPKTPAQLTRHKEFIEFNLWHELEIAAQRLTESSLSPSKEGTIANSPLHVIQSDSPSVWVGRASAKNLANDLPNQTAALVITSPPPRRAAVWALSYFWGAWIFGRSAVQSLAPFLDSSKHEAQWEARGYFDLLASSISSVVKLMRPEARAVFIFTESWQGAVESLVLAAARAKLSAETFLFQPRSGESARHEFGDLPGDFRITFVKPESIAGSQIPNPNLESKIRIAALEGGKEILLHRGEPLAYAWLHHFACWRAAREGLLTQLASPSSTSPAPLLFRALREGLREGYAHDFDHHESAGQFMWLRRAAIEQHLIHRVEVAVREILAERQSISLVELEDEIYRQFPGDLTPEAGLVELCAQTYAEADGGNWTWRDENLATEQESAFALLGKAGERLGYQIAREEKPFDLLWKADGEIAHGFLWRARADFADLARMHVTPARGYLIVPESRAPLLKEKLRRMPHLAEEYYAAGWEFVRVPFVEKLLQEEKIERNDIVLMSGLAPLVAEERAQLDMF